MEEPSVFALVAVGIVFLVIVMFCFRPRGVKTRPIRALSDHDQEALGLTDIRAVAHERTARRSPHPEPQKPKKKPRKSTKN